MSFAGLDAEDPTAKLQGHIDDDVLPPEKGENTRSVTQVRMVSVKMSLAWLTHSYCWGQRGSRRILLLGGGNFV